MNESMGTPGADVAPVESVAVAAARDPRAIEAEVGARLRAAREASGMALDEFARKARVPGGVLADLEAGRFGRLGAAIYVRGYVRSAARAAGIDETGLLSLLEPVAVEQAPLPLPAMQRRSQRVWVARYATPVAYALLTAVVMVPLVYLARPGGGAPASPTLTAIDTAPVSASASLPPQPMPAPASAEPAPVAPPLVVSGPAPSAAEVGPPAPPVASEPSRPVMASLAALPERAAAGTPQKVVLELDDPSWVEFTGSDGSKLEYALLPAGTRREYQLSGSAELRIGNIRGASLTVDGRAIDLDAVGRANVATVRLGSSAEPAAR